MCSKVFSMKQTELFSEYQSFDLEEEEERNRQILGILFFCFLILFLTFSAAVAVCGIFSSLILVVIFLQLC